MHELPAAPSKAAGRHLVAGASPPSTDAPAPGDGPASSAESRVVSGAPDPAVHPTRPDPARRFEPPQRVDGPGYSGLFGSAPPVYDPGGPVLLADRVAADTDLAELNAEAIRLGAVLLVVPAAPGSARARELTGCGWHVASDWYLGSPSATS